MTNSPAKPVTDEAPIDLREHVPALCLSLGSKLAMHAKRHSAAPLDLDLSEWRIVQVLGAVGRATVFDIADQIAMDRGGTSRAILRLERNGYLIRENDPKDRRRSFVALTGEGRQLHRTVAQFANAREERLLSKLSIEDRQRLRQVLNMLIGEAHTMLEDQWSPN